jgi:hypothetical protein
LNNIFGYPPIKSNDANMFSMALTGLRPQGWQVHVVQKISANIQGYHIISHQRFWLILEEKYLDYASYILIKVQYTPLRQIKT